MEQPKIGYFEEELETDEILEIDLEEFEAFLEDEFLFLMDGGQPMRYMVDFETTTKEQALEEGRTRVWAVGITEIESKFKFTYGNEIEFFFNFAKWNGGKYYIHNLKFDGEFIIHWLLNNGFTVCKNKREIEEGQFTTLISKQGQFYTMSIMFENGVMIDIIDSLKIFTFSVDRIAKSFNLPISKLELDYDTFRPIGHELTKTELEYLKNDCEIVARALYIMFSEFAEIKNVGKIKFGFGRKITQGSMSLLDYKRILGKKNFDKWFPILQCDREIRQSYKGGFTYVNERFQGEDVGEGIVLDVNSLYPYVMGSKPLPYGEPKYFSGKYEEDKVYNLYVQMFTCHFELKPGYIPMIQVKGKFSPFMQNEYVKDSEGHDITFCLTNVDLELFLEHYDVYNVEWQGGYKFKSSKKLFHDYIHKWNTIKVESAKDGNEGMRTIAKLMMNALYGKFAKNPKVANKYPYLKEDVVKYYTDEEQIVDPIYIPIGSFITSWGRFITISSAQKMYDRFLYADTDSLHLLGLEVPENLEIDKEKMGAWKLEGKFDRARYVRQKCYIEEFNGELKITCAGMPSRCYPGVTWENFNIGSEFEGKLQPMHLPGGIVLYPVEFTIKDFKKKH